MKNNKHIVKMMAMAAMLVIAPMPTHAQYSDYAAATRQQAYQYELEQLNLNHQMQMERLQRGLRSAEESYQMIEGAMKPFAYQDVLEWRRMIREEQERYMRARRELQYRYFGY